MKFSPEEYISILSDPTRGRGRAATLEARIARIGDYETLLMFCSEKLPPLGTKADLILIDPRAA